ncbi:MAG: PqqD family protein [Tuberibacillus sp.]
MFKRRIPDNLLTLKPCLNEHFLLQKMGNDEHLVMPRTSWIEGLGVKWFRQSPELRYRLDDLGSFVLHRCNGRYTVEDIGKELYERFGERAEPTLNRLVKFLQILDNNSVIYFKKTSADEF